MPLYSAAESICNVIVRSPRLWTNSEETYRRPYNQPDPRVERASLNALITLTVTVTASARPLTEADPGQPSSKDSHLQDYIWLTLRDDNLLAVFCVCAGCLGVLRALLVIVAFEVAWPAVT